MNKKLAALLLVLLTFLGYHFAPTLVFAQALPATKTLAWDASVVDATHSAADNYIVRLDGTIIGSPTSTTQSVTFATIGLHTLTVTANNTWGTSAAASLTVLVAVPNTPGNPRIQ